MHRAEELAFAALSLLILCAAGDRARAEEPPATIEQRWYVTPPPSPTEPKRVRTIRTRGDEADVSPADVGADTERPSPATGYVVHVASQRTAAEALSVYRSLQVKYSVVLGGREPNIRRVDLGDKGVIYRAQVGPFESAGEAEAFCMRLNARSPCVVQKN